MKTASFLAGELILAGLDFPNPEDPRQVRALYGLRALRDENASLDARRQAAIGTLLSRLRAASLRRLFAMRPPAIDVYGDPVINAFLLQESSPCFRVEHRGVLANCPNALRYAPTAMPCMRSWWCPYCYLRATLGVWVRLADVCVTITARTLPVPHLKAYNDIRKAILKDRASRQYACRPPDGGSLRWLMWEPGFEEPDVLRISTITSGEFPLRDQRERFIRAFHYPISYLTADPLRVAYILNHTRGHRNRLADGAFRGAPEC